MEFIPFRIKSSEEPDNFNTIFAFLVKGSNKDPYEVEIQVDDFNDTGLQDCVCSCPDHQFRQSQCKHIKECLEYLKSKEVITEDIKPAPSG